jgi:hypothetical protein
MLKVVEKSSRKPLGIMEKINLLFENCKASVGNGIS